jgi:hypothetical protein
MGKWNEIRRSEIQHARRTKKVKPKATAANPKANAIKAIRKEDPTPSPGLVSK